MRKMHDLASLADHDFLTTSDRMEKKNCTLLYHLFGPTSGRMNELRTDIDQVTCFGSTCSWSKQFRVGDRECYAHLLKFCTFPTVLTHRI